MFWLVATASLALLGWGCLLHWRLGRLASMSKRRGLLLGALGALMAVPVLLVESYALASLQLSLRELSLSTQNTMVAAFFVVVPLEQLGLALVVWPLQRTHRLPNMSSGILAAALAATGFGLVSAGYTMVNAPSGWMAVRAVLEQVSQSLCAAGWGATLTSQRLQRHRFSALALILAVLIQGLSACLLYGRGTGWLVAAIAWMLAMVLSAVAVLRQLQGPRESALPGRLSRLSLLNEATNIEVMRAAWQHRHRPALLHWIVGGALVSFGAVIAAFAAAVWLARSMGIDLSLVGESEVGSFGPVSLMGGMVLLAFPVSGYLVARASGADSVFEAGVGAALTILFLMVLLSLTAPITVILALALAPLAFGLACVGAWMGLDRSDPGH